MANINKLEQILIDMMKEQQIKLGYEQETVRLFLPQQSLEGILGIENLSKEEWKIVLTEFKQKVRMTLGKIRISKIGERFCFTIPPEGNEYVYRHVPKNCFWEDLIQLFRAHNVEINQVKQIFEKYSKDYICEERIEDEFDYLLYFKNKEIDEYYYCVKFDNGHASYHRFTQFDLVSIL